MARMLKLLAPGLHVKRWFLVLLAGMVVLSLGIAYALIDLYRTVAVPAWVSSCDAAVRTHACAIGHLPAAGWWPVRHRAARPVPSPRGAAARLRGRTCSIACTSTVLRQGGPRIVCIGGGTGMPAVLRGLKHFSANITAIVTVGDDGGSSGRLRREHGILPPGDFRNNIVALAEVEPLMSRLFQYRFDADSPLGGHSFGNLFVLAMTGVTGNFEHALRETSRVLAVQGTILPSTLQEVEVCAEFADGSDGMRRVADP